MVSGMTETAEHIEPQTPGAHITVRHPSGWRKSSDGEWSPPESDAVSNDLSTAMSIAVGAIVLGSFLPWAHVVLGTMRGTDGNGNLTLLLGGIAGALIARWRLEGGAHRGLMTASLVVCASAAAVVIYEFTRVVQTAAHPESGLFLAMTGAIAATALAAALRQTPRLATA